MDIVRIDGRIYYFSQTLRCRKFHKTPRTYVNFTYSVTGFERDASGAVTGIFLEETRDFPWAPSLVKRLFIYDFAATCHSLQGMSVSSGISLHDLVFYFVTREWFYTALTRSRDLDEIYFWDPSVVLHNLQVVKEGELELKMERKIAGYKVQDAKAGRLFEEANYVSVEYFKSLLDEQDHRCYMCAELVSLVWKDKDPSQFTLDRLDNDLAHVKGNCVVSCLGCNRETH
jgi:hypothetical protein